jgi:molecular chaperone DnaJ
MLVREVFTVPTRDHYAVLGVPRTDSIAAIRSAFRDRAKQLHPDRRRGDESAFRELREAYEALLHAERRRGYEQTLDPGPWQRTDSSGEPSGAEPMADDVVSIFGDVASVRPSFEELFARFRRNFTGLGVPKGERPEALDFELILTPDEAQRGGVLPFDLPYVDECPWCGGSGEEWPFHCRACRGTGTLERRRVMNLRLPPRIRPGTIFEAPLLDYGIGNLYLRLRVRIGT